MEHRQKKTFFSRMGWANLSMQFKAQVTHVYTLKELNTDYVNSIPEPTLK